MTPADDSSVSLPGSFTAARSLQRELLEELRSSREHGSSTGGAQGGQQLSAPEDDLASILFENYLRRRRGEETGPGAGYEELQLPADSLAELIRRHSVLRSLGAKSLGSGSMLALPSTGDELFGFRLRQELGRGAFARVFLAEQADLAGRPVVLKVSSLDGNEPQTLARLQHTHIVPIYSAHEDPRAGLRAVCMPYYGGASLSRVLNACWAEATAPTRGEHLVRALSAVQTPPPEGTHAGRGPTLQLLEGMSYLQAAAWIVARLAEGLHHAHQRGVLHRDVKPSNVLLGAEGEPMLLDFNLSRNRSDERSEASLGGTVAYMAPEHLRALVGRTAALTRQVDHRADIYSLGMVLYEMLTGQGPFDQSGSYTLLPQQIEAMALERSRMVPSLRQRRPDAPWGLESIVRKCLMPDPARRYQRADQLAEDLHALLHDRPLRHAPELSAVERARKWLRRHPTLTSAGSITALAAIVLAGTLTALLGIHGRLARTRDELVTATARERLQAHDTGTVRALCLLNTASDVNSFDRLREGLHECERTLGLYGALDRGDWQERLEWPSLSATDRQSLAEDTRELLLLLASARLRLEPGEASLQAALVLVDRAERITGLAPSRALWEERAAYLDQRKDSAGAAAARAVAATLHPASARDHYQLAGALVRAAPPGARADAYRRAIAELDEAVRKQPRHYWSWLQRGICHLERGDHALAAADFGVCIGLRSDLPWGAFNRGCALDRGGKKAEAIADYTAALACDDRFVLAHLNRGLARLELRQYPAALDDFDAATRAGRDDAFVHASRGVALEGLSRPVEADGAFERAFERLSRVTQLEQNRIRYVYGFAVSQRLSEQAEAAFQAVLRHDPNQPQALYGLAMLRVQRGAANAVGEAIDLFTRALEAAPDFGEARRFRAVLLARLERFPEAARDINACLEKEPHAGATLYAAACVAALAAEKALPQAAEQAAEQALAFLRQAMARGYGRDRAAADPDLASLRSHRAFQQLTRSGRPATVVAEVVPPGVIR